MNSLVTQSKRYSEPHKSLVQLPNMSVIFRARETERDDLERVSWPHHTQTRQSESVISSKTKRKFNWNRFFFAC